MRIHHLSRVWIAPFATIMVLGLTHSSAPSFAQVPPKGQPGVPPEVMEPPSENPAPPADPGDPATDPKEPLTERLKEGDGVLEPPKSVDPGIKKPVPEDFDSKTPVIKPPADALPGADGESPK